MLQNRSTAIEPYKRLTYTVKMPIKNIRNVFCFPLGIIEITTQVGLQNFEVNLQTVLFYNLQVWHKLFNSLMFSIVLAIMTHNISSSHFYWCLKTYFLYTVIESKNYRSQQLTRLRFTQRRWQAACCCASWTLQRLPRSSHAARPRVHW